jgi:hypothetical protein
MQKPSSWGHGSKGTIAAQQVNAAKYSGGAAFYNTYGDRYARITVICAETAFSLYVYDDDDAWSHAVTADQGAAALPVTHRLIKDATATGQTATGAGGTSFFAPIAGTRYILPVVLNSDAAAHAHVTIKWQTFND